MTVSKGSCPAALLTVRNPPGWGQAGGEFGPCDKFHTFAIDRINQIHPDLLVVSQELQYDSHGQLYTIQQWRQGLLAIFQRLSIPKSNIVVIGNVPHLPKTGPSCLSLNAIAIQQCSGQPESAFRSYTLAEKAAVTSVGGRYIDTTPWFCSKTCTAVIGKYEVYIDEGHVTKVYSYFLEHAMEQALGLAGQH